MLLADDTLISEGTLTSYVITVGKVIARLTWEDETILLSTEYATRLRRMTNI